MMNYSWDSTLPCSVYVYIGGREFRDTEVLSFDINENIIADNKLSVGNICNPTINLKLSNISNDGTDNTDVLNQYLINESFLVYIKSGIGAGVNDIPLGTFRTTSVTIDTVTTTIQGEGRFGNKRFTDEYTTGLDWEQEHWVLDELVDDIDAVDNIDTSMLSPDFLLPTNSDIAFDGKTVKEMLGAVASIYGANVYLNREGKPQFKPLPALIDNPDITLTAADLFSFTPNYNMTQIASVYVSWAELVYDPESEETVVNKGESQYDLENPSDLYNNIQTEIDLPFVIPQRIMPLANSLLEYKYTAFQADILGNPNYEVGDKIQITDYKGDTYTGIIFSIQHSYNGNFSQTITCTTDNTTVQNKKKTGTISGGGGVDEKEAGDIAKEEAEKVADEKINSSATAETVNAFNLDGVFESLITNIKPCLLKYDEENEVYTYVNTAPTNYIRNYIKIFENKLQFIESHFAESSSYSESNTELFTLGGSQVYYTSITGADAYKFLTFTSPSVLHPNDNAELYKVRLPKPTNTYVKSEFKWTYNSTYQSYEPELTFGVGDVQGRGKYKFYKDGDSGRFVYTSRTDGNEYGFIIKDDGIYKVFNNVQYKDMPYKLYSSYADAVADVNNMPTGSFGIVVQ